jgi:AcrR family transcriptional regulator
MDPKHPFRPGFFGGSERRGYHHGRLKDALVDAARSLLAERGPAGFTLAEAAKLVGVTGAAPYRHFSDRNALVAELAKRGFETFGQKLASAWDEGKPDPITAFRRMGSAYLAFARTEPGLYMAMFGSVAALATSEHGAAADQALETLLKAASAILRAFGAPEAGAKDLAFQIWSASHGVAMLALSGHLDAGKGCDPEPILQQTSHALVESAIRRGLNERPIAR